MTIVDSSGVALTVQNSSDASSNQVAIFQSGNRTTPTDNDEGYLSFYNDDSTGTQVEFSRMSWKATDVTNDSKDSQIEFDVMVGDTLTQTVVINSGGIDLPTSGDGYSIEGTSVLTGSTLGSGVTSSSLTTVGTIGTGTWEGTAIGSGYGGTGEDFSGSTGIIKVSSGTFSASSTINLTSEVTGTLPVGNGGTGATTLASNAILTGNGTSAITAETNLSFDGSTLGVTGDVSISGSIEDSNNNEVITISTLQVLLMNLQSLTQQLEIIHLLVLLVTIQILVLTFKLKELEHITFYQLALHLLVWYFMKIQIMEVIQLH